MGSLKFTALFLTTGILLMVGALTLILALGLFSAHETSAGTFFLSASCISITIAVVCLKKTIKHP